MRCRGRQVSYAEATGSRSEGPRLQFYVAGKTVPLTTTIFKVGHPRFLSRCPMCCSSDFDASSDPGQCSMWTQAGELLELPGLHFPEGCLTIWTSNLARCSLLDMELAVRLALAVAWIRCLWPAQLLD